MVENDKKQQMKVNLSNSFHPYEDKTLKVLNKVQVVALIDELHLVLSVVGDHVLHHFLSPVIKLAEEIVRSHRDTALHVLGI